MIRVAFGTSLKSGVDPLEREWVETCHCEDIRNVGFLRVSTVWLLTKPVPQGSLPWYRGPQVSACVTIPRRAWRAPPSEFWIQ